MPETEIMTVTETVIKPVRETEETRTGTDKRDRQSQRQGHRQRQRS